MKRGDNIDPDDKFQRLASIELNSKSAIDLTYLNNFWDYMTELRYYELLALFKGGSKS